MIATRLKSTCCFVLIVIILTSIGIVGSGIAVASAARMKSDIDPDNYLPSTIKQNDPTETLVYNLPIIEHNTSELTPLPTDAYPAPETAVPTITGTPTPTQIPVQSGSENLPIVLGAGAIIVVILLAWFFIGYLPSRRLKQS